MDTINVKLHYLIKRPFKQGRLSVALSHVQHLTQIKSLLLFISIVEKHVISSNTLFNEAF